MEHNVRTVSANKVYSRLGDAVEAIEIIDGPCDHDKSERMRLLHQLARQKLVMHAHPIGAHTLRTIQSILSWFVEEMLQTNAAV